jgi:UDP-N-acetylmuramoyl-L-alanyl-D-glutamate--2,6-diaminopimelate ligase
VGVTGTDGKTTTTHLAAHVLSAVGLQAGFLSSVEFGAGGRTELNLSHMTTLESTEVQRRLAAIRDAGDRYAVVEASSIGLEMHRVDQCEFDVGVFTNLTQDHLDYHKTMNEYRDAKAALFRMLDASMDKGMPKAAVLNADDAASEAMRAATSAAVVTYGLRSAADIVGQDITVEPDETRFVAVYQGRRAEARSPLLGDFNVANGLAAIGVAVTQGAAFGDAVAALASFPGVPGRMERIDEGQGFGVIVDIASTEQAMRNVLQVLRPATKGRIIVLFGAAGERDRERRSGLARAVAAGGDYAIIANEDPRHEGPEAIIDEIASALEASGFGAFERIADRRAAMGRAFEVAATGDMVLLAGKATEPSIDIGDEHVPWDERGVARELLRGGKAV